MKFKLSPIQKTSAIIVGLVFITWFASFITEKVFEYRKSKKDKEKDKYKDKENQENAMKLREGFDITKAGDWDSAFNPKKNGVSAGFDKAGDEISKVFRKVEEALQKSVEIFDTVTDFFNDVTNFFNGLATGFPNLGKGIQNHAEVGANEIGDGFKYGAINLAIILDCAFDKFGKAFYGCTLYYIVDIIYGITYGLFIELPLVLMNAIFGIDLAFIGDDIIKPILSFLDDIAYSMSGFHIDRWPESVQSKCYKCKSFYDGSEATFTERSQDFYNTNEQLRKGFTSLFGVIPNPAWGNWWKGNNLDGNDQTNIFS